MDFSVVVPTYNRRQVLVKCLDAIETNTDAVELIVVNGPSTDGTSGMVRNRSDVDILLEVAERNINVARNAGITTASGDVIAFINHCYGPGPGWQQAVTGAITDGAAVISGPVDNNTGLINERLDWFDTGFDLTSGNIAMNREAIVSTDGFDEYLKVGGIADLAHRLRGLRVDSRWSGGMRVRSFEESQPDDERWTIPFLEDEKAQWGLRYRSLGYILAKNYGIRPRVPWWLGRRAFVDAGGGARDVIKGTIPPTSWFANGWAVVSNGGAGIKAGLLARRRDPTATRNPNGVSMRLDRIVDRYDQNH